jgi:hypothetical protein
MAQRVREKRRDAKPLIAKQAAGAIMKRGSVMVPMETGASFTSLSFRTANKDLTKYKRTVYP